MYMSIYYPPEVRRRELGVLGVGSIGSIPVAILPSYQHMKIIHHNCIDMNKDGY